MSAYDPPCWASGDHYWRDGACSVCGEPFRCVCGRFIKVQDIDRHMVTDCPSLMLRSPMIEAREAQ